jgi:transposase InsO family protein
MVLKAFYTALINEKAAPSIFHSDQDSEYRSEIFSATLKRYEISQSMSPKASPWRNGFQ